MFTLYPIPCREGVNAHGKNQEAVFPQSPDDTIIAQKKGQKGQVLLFAQKSVADLLDRVRRAADSDRDRLP